MGANDTTKVKVSEAEDQHRGQSNTLEEREEDSVPKNLFELDLASLKRRVK